MIPTPPTRPFPARASRRLVVAIALALLILAAPVLGAGTEDLERQLEEQQAKLDDTEAKEGVLTSTLDRIDARLSRLTGEVAALRNREAAVQAELKQLESRLRDAESDLEIARERLQRATQALRDRLVSIYKAEEPSVMTFILDAEGIDDALGRASYLSALQRSNDQVIDQVRELRNTVRDDVELIRSARDEIAAREAELEAARVDLEIREAELRDAGDRQRALLSRVRSRSEELDEDVGDLQERIQKKLRAAQAAAAEQAAVAVPGGISPESSGEMIWPIDGTLTSPFGWRWGRMHEGLDIAAPEGVPIAAAADGEIVIAGPNGGYGNYTCIDHGDGLSSCYAHQSSIAVSPGQSVSQGEVIGAVGNTGASTGPHVHFETRVNGSAVDPMGYL